MLSRLRILVCCRQTRCTFGGRGGGGERPHGPDASRQSYGGFEDLREEGREMTLPRTPVTWLPPDGRLVPGSRRIYPQHAVQFLYEADGGKHHRGWYQSRSAERDTAPSYANALARYQLRPRPCFTRPKRCNYIQYKPSWPRCRNNPDAATAPFPPMRPRAPPTSR